MPVPAGLPAVEDLLDVMSTKKYPGDPYALALCPAKYHTGYRALFRALRREFRVGGSRCSLSVCAAERPPAGCCGGGLRRSHRAVAVLDSSGARCSAPQPTASANQPCSASCRAPAEAGRARWCHDGAGGLLPRGASGRLGQGGLLEEVSQGTAGAVLRAPAMPHHCMHDFLPCIKGSGFAGAGSCVCLGCVPAMRPAACCLLPAVSRWRKTSGLGAAGGCCFSGRSGCSLPLFLLLMPSSAAACCCCS